MSQEASETSKSPHPEMPPENTPGRSDDDDNSNDDSDDKKPPASASAANTSTPTPYKTEQDDINANPHAAASPSKREPSHRSAFKPAFLQAVRDSTALLSTIADPDATAKILALLATKDKAEKIYLRRGAPVALSAYTETSAPRALPRG